MSSQTAWRRFALAYTNWEASRLAEHEYQLASLAIGEARIAAEQTAASQSTNAELAANHVRNKGIILTIAPGQGPARGQWVIVTQEQTSGTDAYAGLPPSVHVTIGRTARLGHGYAISDWSPRN